MILAALALAIAPAAPGAHDDLIGRYTLVDERGRIVCKLRMLYEPTVGGEVDAPKTCAKALPVDDGLRWFPTSQGGYSIRDALHREVATIASSEAGYILYVGKVRYDLEAPDYTPPAAPTLRAVGRWKVQNNDAKVICRIQFLAGGAVGPAATCPAVVRPFGGGRWSATEDSIILKKAGRTMALSWEDEDELSGDNLRLAFVRDHGK